MDNAVITIMSGSLAALNVMWAGIAVFNRTALDEHYDNNILWARRYAYMATACSVIFLVSLYT
jgi:hypothetical protein